MSRQFWKETLTWATASSVKTSNGNGAQSVTTTNAGDLIIAVAATQASTVSNPTWTNATLMNQNPNTTGQLVNDAYQIETSTGTYTPYVSWTGTARQVEQITIALLPLVQNPQTLNNYQFIKDNAGGDTGILSFSERLK